MEETKKEDKSLKDKAIDIRGKSYVMVSDRIIYFNNQYPNGVINTELITPIESKHIIFRATITPDIAKAERKFNAYSQATVGEGMVNKTAALENAETSAVGRALAFMGIGVIDGVASADEINKATGNASVTPKTPRSVPQDAEGKVCSLCGENAVISAKTGNPYCPRFRAHKDAGEKYNLISKGDQEFYDSLPDK